MFSREPELYLRWWREAGADWYDLCITDWCRFMFFWIIGLSYY